MLKRQTAVWYLCALSCGWIAPSYAEEPFSEEQRKAFADVFHMSQPRAAQGTTNQADQRELAMILSAQDARVILPGTVEAYKTYLAKNPLLGAIRNRKAPTLGVLMFWNLTALDITAIDHTLLATSNSGHEQFGPHRTSRVLAIAHLAMFEAVNTIADKYTSYKGIDEKIIADLHAVDPTVTRQTLGPNTASTSTAIIAAAHDTLAALYPKKVAFLDLAQQTALRDLGLGTDPAALVGKDKLGFALGQSAARNVLAERGYDPATTASTHVSTFSDGSSQPEPKADDPRFAGDGPDRWHPDPIHPLGLTALGGNWMNVRPFVITHADAFRPATEPAKTTSRFITAYKEVKKLGGDSTPNLVAPRGSTPTSRTKDQGIIGDFWAYDGTAFLCAPPRLYNEIATTIALKRKPIKTVAEMARFLALVNIAMADAGISAWDAKYSYRLGRPVTYIRAVSVDGTLAGSANPTWTPKGAPVSNGDEAARNLTPAFPSFPSGHAVFGGAVFQIFREYWQTNGHNENFSFMSDEYNGHNSPPGSGTPRPMITKYFATFASAESENARSRIYLGIHWQFDADVGVSQGHEVGEYVYNNVFQPK